MRAVLCFAVALCSLSAHAAGFSGRPFLLTTPDGDTAAPALAALADRAPLATARPRESLPLLGPQRPMPGGRTSGFSIGPFYADAIARYSRSGKPHLAPHYRLEGVTVLGGSIGGSVDSRGGMVTLDWRTGP